MTSSLASKSARSVHEHPVLPRSIGDRGGAAAPPDAFDSGHRVVATTAQAHCAPAGSREGSRALLSVARKLERCCPSSFCRSATSLVCCCGKHRDRSRLARPRRGDDADRGRRKGGARGQQEEAAAARAPRAHDETRRACSPHRFGHGVSRSRSRSKTQRPEAVPLLADHIHISAAWTLAPTRPGADEASSVA